jgi:hypothetical protein
LSRPGRSAGDGPRSGRGPRPCCSTRRRGCKPVVLRGATHEC